MSPMNSRQLAEEIWKSVANALQDETASELEPLDREGLLQELEGVLERHGGIKADPELMKAREENEKKGLELS